MVDVKVVYGEWEQWLKTPRGREAMEAWPNCDNCECECDQCVFNLVGLEDEEQEEFLERVKVFVEGLVEELYLHPNWGEEEYNEYGYEMGYLVELYFKYNLETL